MDCNFDDEIVENFDTLSELYSFSDLLYSTMDDLLTSLSPILTLNDDVVKLFCRF